MSGPETLSERNRRAQELFAPLAPTYDRYARLLSFGQDPRWRRFLVSRMGEIRPEYVFLDVATGTAAVAIELVRRYDCHVIGVDQSPEMLEIGRRRVVLAGASAKIRLQEARAEDLPFEDGTFDGLAFTYLLRYVDDPEATMRELARVVRPGGKIAGLEFSIPSNPLARAFWELYVRVGLPVLGRAVSPGWAGVGAFLGPSIRSFYARHPIERVFELWQSAGIRDVQAKPMSLGGGVVVWGVRGD
jgi:demethylmenaquinone methyltransferase/2-methoxy-6-polyprenyl-1,4-benzoquinol methylase